MNYSVKNKLKSFLSNLFSTKKHLFGKIGVNDVIYIQIVLELFYTLRYL